MIAAYNQQPAMVELLVEQGADVDRPDTSGNSPLMGCAFQGFRRVAELLLNHGADPKREDDEGRTAADLAEGHGHEQIARRLQEARPASPPS